MIDVNGRSSPGWIVATLLCGIASVLAVLIAAMLAVVLLSREAHPASRRAPAALPPAPPAGRAIWPDARSGLRHIVPIAAQPAGVVCAAWADIKRQAADRYGEHEVSSGQINPVSIIVVLASPDGETFTVAVIGRNGKACVIASGRGWEPGRLPQAPIETRRS